MPQHLWIEGHATLSVGPAAIRACEVCLARQVDIGTGWSPHVGAICPGELRRFPGFCGAAHPLAAESSIGGLTR